MKLIVRTTQDRAQAKITPRGLKARQVTRSFKPVQVRVDIGRAQKSYVANISTIVN